MVAVAAAAVAVPAILAGTAPPPRVAPLQVARPRIVAPPTVVPEVEPVAYQAVDPDDARRVNAAVPFVGGPNPAAAAFRFAGAAEDRARAAACLAAAVLYEAGDDRRGQQAVAQVVLNRLRHPAFPKTVCGVVFQGSERRTGCQFTFTCDGALARDVPAAFWDRARRVADEALAGAVFRPVGLATHYHTDWVVPYWSASLDKIAAVDTHLFFRWTGWWGTPPAFRRRADQNEPRVTQLAQRFAEHKLPEVLAAEAEGAAVAALAAAEGGFQPLPDDPDAFAVALPATDPAGWQALAVRSCGTRTHCKFLGWTDAGAVPAAGRAPLSAEALASMSFSYLRDRERNYERAFWNCEQVARPAAQCMRRTPRVAAPQPAASASPAATAPGAAPALGGVRRREPAPVPTPSPTPVRE